MEIQPPTPPNPIRTLALVPEPLKVEPAVVIEAKPIPRSSDQLDFEPDDLTESEVAQWNAFLEHEIGWRARLLNIAASRRRILTPHQRRQLRGELYEIERGQRCDVTWPWDETHQLLPPPLSQALWHETFAIREQERIDGRLAAIQLAAIRFHTDPSLTLQERMALHRECCRLDDLAPRIGRTLPESWKPKRTDPLRAFRQSAMRAVFPNTGSI